MYLVVNYVSTLLFCSSRQPQRIAQSLKEEQMKQMSQESVFSDVQLEDADRKRNSNAVLFLQDVILFFQHHGLL